MADSLEKIQEYYVTNLKAEPYVSTIEKYWSELSDVFRSMMVSIHDVFKSGRFKGSKLLEIGSGATVHNIASASAYFSNIVMSDFVEDNVEQLKRWLRGDSNLKQLLDIPAELEGYGKDLETGRKILEARIRKNVKRVTRSDVLKDGILLDESGDPEISPPFDMIVTCLTLEAAPKDLKGYFDSMKRINAILRPGGGFLACGFINGGKWKIEDSEFNHVRVTEEDIQKALTQAGFGKITLKTFSTDKSDTIIDYEFEKIYFVTAEKL